MNASSNRGFTLIELIIVVGILAVLASLAMPAFQNYVVRASMSEAFLEMSRVKTDLTEFHAQTGRFPAATEERAQFVIDSADGHPVIRHLNVQGVGACNPSAGCDHARVEIQLQRRVYRGINGDANSQIRLEAQVTDGGGIEWRCGPRDTQGVKLEWLPSTCRYTG